MKKILIAIKDDFTKSLYQGVFEKEGYKVLIVEKEDSLMIWLKIEKTDIVLVDVGFILQEDIKNDFIKETSEKKIPIIAVGQYITEEGKEKAIELGAKDFISSSDISPSSVVDRARMIMGEEKSYLLSINKEEYNGLELIKEIKGDEKAICPKCQQEMALYLIRDLSKGKNYYKVSLICPKCL